LSISKRRAKRLAAAVIVHSTELGMWEQLLYTVVDGRVSPFAMQSFETSNKRSPTPAVHSRQHRGFVEMDEAEIENYILKNTHNEWHPSQYKRVQRAGTMRTPNEITGANAGGHLLCDFGRAGPLASLSFTARRQVFTMKPFLSLLTLTLTALPPLALAADNKRVPFGEPACARAAQRRQGHLEAGAVRADFMLQDLEGRKR
jgi:hypothetical protein